MFVFCVVSCFFQSGIPMAILSFPKPIFFLILKKGPSIFGNMIGTLYGAIKNDKTQDTFEGSNLKGWLILVER